jgi:uncharacterized membrane protein
MPWLIAYLATGATFGVLDALWLRWAGPHFYRPMLGDMLAASFRAAPAIAFYLIYVAALVWFAVGPWFGVANGALLGLVAYATYDLTNQATMKQWPLQVTLVDIAWGAAASALASGVGALAVKHFAVVAS